MELILDVKVLEVGAILFSGGTTGIPKQINHSHKCIISMVDRMEWGWPTTRMKSGWLWHHSHTFMGF